MTGGPEARARGAMPGMSERIRREVRDIYPQAACLPCLAARAGLTEPEARRAAQAPVTRGELLVVRTVCHWCQAVRDALQGNDNPAASTAA
jgi:hypothetical protein